MINQSSNKPGRRSNLPRLDRNVLLGTLCVMALVFIATWLASRDFMPGARLFPNFVAGLGVGVTVIAILRVWLGIEPGQGVGQVLPNPNESAWPAYRYAGIMFACISAYYLGVFFLGFMPATFIFLVTFTRYHKLPWTFCLGGAVMALAFVYGLSELLGLFLPWGVFERFL